MDYKNKDLIFEAVYISNKINTFGKDSIILKSNIKKSLDRILKVINIKDEEKFLNENKNSILIKQSQDLYNKILMYEEGSFFNKLTEEEYYIYSCLNYDVSYEYGVNLAQNINFSGKSILDIGGNTGGLCSGIKCIYEDLNADILDYPNVCYIGEEINKEVNFIKGDFFKPINLNKNYDYIILSNVLHDWNDENCLKILKNISNATSKKSKIIIYEDILLEDKNIYNNTVLYGLRLSVNVPQGCQRTVKEFNYMIKEIFGDSISIQKVINFGVHSAIIVV